MNMRILLVIVLISIPCLTGAQPQNKKNDSTTRDKLSDDLVYDPSLDSFILSIYPMTKEDLVQMKLISNPAPMKQAQVQPNKQGQFIIKSNLGNSEEFGGHDGRYVRGGYEVRLAYPKADTQEVQDPVSGEYIWKIKQHILYPAAVNGERIYRYADVTKHADQRRHKRPLEDYILNRSSKRLKALPDGSYRIKMENVIVNKDGEIVYYELDGIVGLDDRPFYHKEIAVASTIKIPIDNEVRAIMNNAPSMKPAKINGKRVFYLADVYLYQFRIDVKNGVPTFLFRDLQPI